MEEGGPKVKKKWVKRGQKGAEPPPEAPPAEPERPPLPPPPPPSAAAPAGEARPPVDPYKLVPERPGKEPYLDEDRKTAILDQLLVHPVWEDAFDVARISRRTGWRWLARGRVERDRLQALADAGQPADPDPAELPFLELLEAGEFYRAMHKSDLVTIVRQAAQDNPEHAKWLLTHCYGAEFNAPQRVIIEKEQAAFLDRLKAALPPEVYVYVLRVGSGQPRPPAPFRVIPGGDDPGGGGGAGGGGDVAPAGAVHPAPQPEVPLALASGAAAGGAGGDREG